MRKVLLLNASFEALGTIAVARAVSLLWKGSAEMVERDGDRVLRSQRAVFPVPSVVRLTHYIDIRGRQRRSSSKRNRILARDKYRCMYCGSKGNDFTLTMDHMLPRSRGGQTAPENLVAACKPCNDRKGARTPEEARMPLMCNPAALTYGLDRQILCHEAEIREEWKVYLFMKSTKEGVA